MYNIIIIGNWLFNNVNISLFFRLFHYGIVNPNSFYCTFSFNRLDKIIILILTVLIILTGIILLIKIRLYQSNVGDGVNIPNDLFCKTIFRLLFSLIFCGMLFIEEFEIGKNIYWLIMTKTCIESLQGTFLFFVFFKEEKVIKILFKFENINFTDDNNNYENTMLD